MPNIRWLIALITRLQRALYLRTHGAIGARIGRKRFLLLTTVGRRTGRRRVTPLLYVQDGERFVVVASNGGDDRPPAWWLNLEAQPQARVQAGDAHHEVEARRAEGEELARLWPLLEASYSYYPKYRERTSREIPVVVLEPARA